LHLQRSPWRYKHPALQNSFYNRIDAPLNFEDAKHLYKVCQQTVLDYEDQIEILDLKIKEKEEELNDCPYLMDQIKKMKSQTISLRESKRFYRNKGLAYEYYMDKTYRQN
tara:strand:+ start:3308 stop:3637 length:330 start_codon:yes stop_codon:yes gene_type:complete